jgi:hypothetical protein
MTESNHEPEDLGFNLPVAARTSRTSVVVVLLVLVGGLFAVGYVRHRSSQAAVPEPGADTRAARVDTIKPVVLPRRPRSTRERRATFASGTSTSATR